MRRKHSRLLAIVVAIATVTNSLPMTAVASTWNGVTGAWELTRDDGIKACNEWQYVQDNWYHFDAMGAMQTG